MNKYKFANGYTAEWSNKAVNPDSINVKEVRWSPKQPNLQDCGNQFIGEYLYGFIPRLCQPSVNRMQKSMLYCFDTAMGPVVEIEFRPNERPKYNQMVFPLSVN